MSVETILLIVTLLAGFYMSWAIGANDVANAMGTSVGSGALTLKQAVIIAAILEFSGAFFFGSHVSSTIQKGIIDPSIFNGNPSILVYGMLASLLASATWLQLATYWGLPVSTTHSIVGAVVGFGALVGGAHAVMWKNVAFIVSSWIISPLAGGIISFIIFSILRKKIFYHQKPLQEAKKLVPILPFALVISMAIIFLFQETKTSGISLSSEQKSLVSVGCAFFAAIAAYFLVKNVKHPKILIKQKAPQSSDVLYSLSKAKKHLKKIEGTSVGEINYQISHMLNEIDTLNDSLVQEEESSSIHTEYAAVEKIFGWMQILTASLMAFAHGANDVANAIGPLAAAFDIIKYGTINNYTTIPTWALALGGGGIVVGLATWGWRVIMTIGKKITELTPSRGFAAEFGAATTVLAASKLGMPISTTHTLVGAVIGVGMAKGIGALNLGMTKYIFISWIVTIPAGAALAILYYNILLLSFG